ncbi:Subtilisin-like protease SBT5.3 [Carex littledalei]|uniref:Subtilisin-like protease SBT5.3 n=1 Tax=Carex littledalei TaxID=544730 RepID=A0A833QFC7_9POAL|nr:Subtilisin-like protease SBT5.3 [Carex littledalei]
MGNIHFWFALLSYFLLKENAIAADKVPYIVYLGEAPRLLAGSNKALQYATVAKSHFELLGPILGSLKAAENAIFYSYTQHINGFAATLDEDTANKISKLPGVVSVFQSREYELQTTRSWQFLGLESDGNVISNNSLWSKAGYGKDTIIGNIDTGVWPESKSFADDGMAAVPSQWKGICQNQSDATFTCNKKLIGARYFSKGSEAVYGPLNVTYTPRDKSGHGTHTLSTAGGTFVANASFFGHGSGTAKGGSPYARVATYKVCWLEAGRSCNDADIIAAFDAAISDGVHVVSVSLGGPPGDYFEDGIAIGSFHAVKNGIKVVCSAGNSGPTAGTVSNLAPWIFTVAASTMDREFPAYVSFGNTSLKGLSLSSTSLAQGKYPIIIGLCLLGSLDSAKVNGSIVICTSGNITSVEKGEAVLEAGGVDKITLKLTSGSLNYSAVLGYITKPETVLNTMPAPYMASFSSQGPNTITPGILKPDITAPGVLVLAAWTESTSPTGRDFDKRRVKFNIISGTSMSCPHISGVVGLLHTLYPNWSPAAIRSAIMTTASIKDNQGKNILSSSFITATPFSYGSGHVNPNAAADPGLIYDLNATDYLNFLCSLGYNSTQLSSFQSGYQCPSNSLAIKDLNYPSFSIYNLTGSVTVTRKVKNVGPAGTYNVTVEEPRGIRVKVEPGSLTFSVGEEKKFNVTFNVDTPSTT